MRATLAPSRSSQHPFADLRRLRRRRFSIPAVLALLAASLIASCIEPDLPLERAAEDRRHLTISLGNGQDLTLPVTFSGDLPCKDCIARRVTLTLRPDTVFLTRTIWLGDPEPNEAYDLGRWNLDASGRRLILKGGADGIRLAMIDPDAIRMLGVDANDSTGSGAATLARARSVERFDEPLRLRGYFLHTRAGPVLGECSSRKRWPIAAEAEYFVLERAYRAARLAPGAPLLVSVDGRLVLRRRSSGEREMVVIERVNRLWREGDCKNDPTRPNGLRQPWQLVGAAARFGPGQPSRARERAGTARAVAGRY